MRNGFSQLRCFLIIALLVPSAAWAGLDPVSNFVQIKAKDKFERTKIANAGVSIEATFSDSVYGSASAKKIEQLKRAGFEIVEAFPERIKDFPAADRDFHNYAELTHEIDSIVASHLDIMRKISIGKTIEGRDIWAVHINTSLNRTPEDAVPVKPGIVFMGNHHAREHVSAEIPLMLLQFLARNYGVDRELTALIDARDIYIIPMVNPDGVEYDIATGRYRMHRKNARRTGAHNIGIDLNRNYGYRWNGSKADIVDGEGWWPKRSGGGSSGNPEDETYRGPSPFSEPETQAIRDFIAAHPNLKILLSYHTYSELILYPWGWSYDPIANEKDHRAFEAMARRMSEWNHYTPRQSSDLYLATGDTTDWAYGTYGIFSFTFELSPRDAWGSSGFYPGAGILNRVFEDNLKPAFYLIDLADDPYRSLQKSDRWGIADIGRVAGN